MNFDSLKDLTRHNFTAHIDTFNMTTKEGTSKYLFQKIHEGFSNVIHVLSFAIVSLNFPFIYSANLMSFQKI